MVRMRIRALGLGLVLAVGGVVVALYGTCLASLHYYRLTRDSREFTRSGWAQCRGDECLQMLGSLERRLASRPHTHEELVALLGVRWRQLRTLGRPLYCVGDNAYVLIRVAPSGVFEEIVTGCHP